VQFANGKGVRACAIRIFDRLTQAQAAGGELDAALDTVVRWLALDPLNEVAQPFKATIASALCADCVLAGEWATARDYAHVTLDFERWPDHLDWLAAAGEYPHLIVHPTAGVSAIGAGCPASAASIASRTYCWVTCSASRLSSGAPW
jgi:hypothetical protein